MKFMKRNIDEVLDNAILCKEGWIHSGADKDNASASDSPVKVYEGLNIGFCGVNDTVLGCSG